MGEAYLRYSFTKGTANEVEFLVEQLGLQPGHRVLDVGCGPGRHAHALARLGMQVVGVDISARFVELARRDAAAGSSFERLDARELPFDGQFDAAISLCQGAFGLCGGPAASGVVDPDGAVLAGMARAVRPGGRVAVSAFSAYFQVRWLEDSDDFDADAGVNRETTEVMDGDGVAVGCEAWTTCFTPRELRLLAAANGLVVDAIWSVTPGRYEAVPPTIDTPEFLLVARRRAATSRSE